MMKFLRIALNEYKPNQHKRRKELKLKAIHYYKQAHAGTAGLWATMYADKPYGKKLYDAITGHIASLSTRCAYCQDKIFHNANLNVDHILPAKIYPQFVFCYSNLTVSCVTCNAIKSDTDYFSLKPAGNLYPDSNHPWSCFHPNHQLYAGHIDRFVIQTNHINLRAYIGSTPGGKVLCRDLLSKVSEFETKSIANPRVASAIENLGNYIAKYPADTKESLNKLIAAMAQHI